MWVESLISWVLQQHVKLTWSFFCHVNFLLKLCWDCFCSWHNRIWPWRWSATTSFEKSCPWRELLDQQSQQGAGCHPPRRCFQMSNLVLRRPCCTKERVDDRFCVKILLLALYGASIESQISQQDIILLGQTLRRRRRWSELIRHCKGSCFSWHG